MIQKDRIGSAPMEKKGRRRTRINEENKRILYSIIENEFTSCISCVYLFQFLQISLEAIGHFLSHLFCSSHRRLVNHFIFIMIIHVRHHLIISSNNERNKNKNSENWDHEIIPRSVPCVVSCDTYTLLAHLPCLCVGTTYFSFYILWIFLTETEKNLLKRKSKTIVSSLSYCRIKYRLFSFDAKYLHIHIWL